MRPWILVPAAVLAFVTEIQAGDLGIHVILSGQVAPGVYGQVQLGNAPPPPLVYAEPVLIEAQPTPPLPVYLHVPPEHAHNWRKHCHAYHACNRPVYFVRSDEYETAHRLNQEHGQVWGRHDDDRGRERSNGHGHPDDN